MNRYDLYYHTMTLKMKDQALRQRAVDVKLSGLIGVAIGLAGISALIFRDSQGPRPLHLPQLPLKRPTFRQRSTLLVHLRLLGWPASASVASATSARPTAPSEWRSSNPPAATDRF